jgi:hypothetical protein
VTKPPAAPAAKEQQLLRNARREGLIIMAVWAAALAWTVGFCYSRGYHRAPEQIQLVFGFPDWVFWGIVLPWALCLAFSFWFCFFFMADDDLGQDRDEGPTHV